MRRRQRSALALLLLSLAAASSAWDWDLLQRLAQQRFGAGALPAVREWRATLQDARNAPAVDKLARVNTFFNQRLRFVDDAQAWSQPDYWATPLETLGRGEGDCEDFAIAKYFSLLQLGVPERELRLVYVKARIGGLNSTLQQAHMVLTWFATPDADPLVLDNLVGELRPASRRPDLTPIFSFNSEGIYAGPGGASAGGINRLSRWRDVLERARGEGLQGNTP